MIGALRAILLAGAAATVTGIGARAEVTYEILRFDQLDGWEKDDHAAALRAFLVTCPDLDAPDWQTICALAQQIEPDAAQQFFELFFRPVLVRDGAETLFTGYYEPELNGSRTRTERFRYPLYRMPPEARKSNPWLSRRQIVESGVLEGRGLEIAWVDDPVELFFLQIQGSGRIRLQDGTTIRVGYGGSNGHPYRSIGVEMVRRGIYKPHQVSAQVIRNWVRRNPEAGRELLLFNPGFVFFRIIREIGEGEGPLGAMNQPLTPLRSIAVDPEFVPLGAPVWIEKDGAGRMHRLMIAQDTGSAIRGAQRADIFFGTGDAAGQAAGRLRDRGRMAVLLPIQRAWAMIPEDLQ